MPPRQFIKQDRMEQQLQADEAVRTCFREKRGTFQRPEVLINPYKIAPLTALVCFQTPVPVSIHVRVRGHQAQADITYGTKAETEHLIPVYGLYAGEENIVELTGGDGEKTVLTISTAGGPELLQKAECSGTWPENKLTFLVGAAGTALTAGYDCMGDCRWYCTEPLCYCFQPSRQGTILAGAPELLMPPYGTTALWEMTLYGKVIREYQIPGGMHHAPFELADGDLLLMTEHREDCTVEDCCVLVDRASGEIRKKWDLKEYLPTDQGGSPHQDDGDWFHNNAVWYDEERERILFSGRHQNCVLALDLETGQIQWILGSPERWDEAFTQKHFLEMAPGGDWFYEQGDFALLEDGTLLCLDDGCGRPGAEQYSRGVIYQLDEEKRSVTQVGEIRASEYSPYLGSCVQTDGTYLLLFGGQARENGEIPAEPGVFNLLRNPEIQLTAEVQEWDGQRAVGSMKLRGNFYRASRIAPGDCLRVIEEPGTYLGTWGETTELPLELAVSDAGLIPESYQIKLTQMGHRLYFEGVFNKGEMVLLRLESPERNYQYYLSTTRVPLNVMWLGTYMGWTVRPFKCAINTEQMRGTYTAAIIIDDKKYGTGLTVKLGDSKGDGNATL